MRRIVVVGTSGSGKTTMARTLAACLGLRHIELDALHWEPGWQEADPQVFRQRVDEATADGGWASDGNYSAVRDILWARADTVVWLDYPLTTILTRLSRRTLRRVFFREELWNGNHERFSAQFLSRDSIFLWALQTYQRNKRRYAALIASAEYAHLRVVRLHSPREAERWLAELCGKHR